MTFIYVPHERRNAHGPQCPYPTNTQDDFLGYPVIPAASVKLAGYIPVFPAVSRHIGIQKIQINLSNDHFPDPGINSSSRQFNRNVKILTVFVCHRLHGHLIIILKGVLRFLPTIPVDSLGKVSLPVKQAYGHQRHTQITGGFAMIPCQQSQAPGINWMGLVESEFGRKISHRLTNMLRIAVIKPGLGR